MKKLILSAILLCSVVASFACTNLIVGKKASADGSVMCTYNCDSFGFLQPLDFFMPGRHAEGEMITIRSWGPQTSERFVAEAPYTYKVVGLMNENQVSIVETTWGGRRELMNRDGYLDYFTLMHLALQRSTSAREAIVVMHGLVQEYGYSATGESFAVCDKDEAWIMELVGKGPGRKGAVWVALRVPDDCVCAYANASRIRQFPQVKKVSKADRQRGYCEIPGECMYAADVVSLARELGFYEGSDADFSFREAYGPLDFSAIRYCEARVWSFFRRHYDTAEMDAYLPFINGDTSSIDHLPLWIKPKAPVSVRELMDDMRDHYEGTALDMTADVSAGPYASPYRSQSVNFFSSDSTAMFRERPIGCQQSGMTMVCQMRSWLPDAVGGVTYFNMDDATTSAYVPVYCGITRVPEPFRAENNDIRVFSTESAFWMNNFVANMVYPRWSAMIGDLRDAQKELEDYYAADQKEVEEKAVKMTPGDRAAFLTAKTEAYTDKMMKRWDKLARFLIVKHNDQTMQPSENGEIVRGRRTAPAYAPAFIDAVKTVTGDRYVKPKEK